MTLGDRIREMTDEELADFLQWSVPDSCTDPETEEDCPDFDCGCANNCPHDRKTENMLRWVQSENYSL